MNDQGFSPNQYREVQIETSTTLDLVTMAYDGIVVNLDHAIQSLENNSKSYDVFNEKLSKAQQIVAALDDGLDGEQGELSELLTDFYAFVRAKLIDANMSKSVDEVKEVCDLVKEVRNYWIAAGSTEEADRLPTSDTESSETGSTINSTR